MTGIDDAFHKFERGEKHLIDFYKSIVSKLKNSKVKFDIRKRPYKRPPSDSPKYWTIYTLHVTNLPVISKQDGILLGEVIQSFRSSLDYLAWALVAKHSKRVLTESERRDIQFPMFTKRSQFKKKVSKILLNVPSKLCAFFEGYQPYRRSTNGITMRYLRILSNTDKHRIIVPTLICPESSEGKITPHAGEIVKYLFHLKNGQELKNGAKITTFILAGNDPSQFVHIDTTLSILLMFPKTILRPSITNDIVLIEPALKSIRDACFEILNEAKKYF